VEILKAGNRNTTIGEISAVLLIFLVLPHACLTAQAQSDITFTPEDTFAIPASNGTISYGFNGTYANASLMNDLWTFINLHLDNSPPLEKLEVSAQNSNITIIAYSTFDTRFQGFRGALLSYKVEGQGKQTFNIGVPLTKGEWSVLLEDEFKGQGDGWSVSPDATLTITGAKTNVTIWYFGFPESFNVDEDANKPFYTEHSAAIATAAALAITVTFAFAVKRKNQTDSGKNGFAATRMLTRWTRTKPRGTRR
jgi:hypothetical protein